MRYFAPRVKEVIKQINQYNPTEVILLPLYPQFSTTTTGSSIKEFLDNFNSNVPIKTICCYPLQEDFIKAHTLLIKKELSEFKNIKNFRILFSAHGLPKKIIESGDPYQWQIEETVKAIVSKLEIDNLDYKVTYQSKLGPIEWLKPSTEEQIEIAGKLKKDLIIVPIAFVSEHVETLVELDKEYKIIADKYKIIYIRTPALSVNKIFIKGLVKVLFNFINNKDNTNKNLVLNDSGRKICPENFIKCFCNIYNK
jgi:ferrochelatase